MFKCICKICGHEFEAVQPKSSTCVTCKNRPCLICGKNFTRTEPYDQKFCSKECRYTWLRSSEYKSAATAKRINTVKMKYGVSNVSELSSVKEKIRQFRKDKDTYLANKAEEAEKNRRTSFTCTCLICGDIFEAPTLKGICSKKHFRTCECCGKEYEIFSSCERVQRRTCSEECRKLLLKKQINSSVKICEYCGKEFHPTGNMSRYCDGPHYKKCEICKKEFEIDLKSGMGLGYLPRTCSIECRRQLIEQTSLKKYGVKCPAQRPEAIEAARQKSIENKQKSIQTCLEKYGYPYASQHPAMRKYLSERTNSEEVRNKMKKTCLEKYGVEWAMQSPDIARRHSGSQFKQVTCDGTSVDSRWEAIFYDFLVRNNIKFEYNTQSIDFEYNGQHHKTHIDFKVGDLLFEVKGSHLIDGAYSNAPGVIPISVKLDLYKKNHVIVITDSTCKDTFGKPNSTVSNGLKYLNKCSEPLIGVDIQLFDHPEFPYAEDRPPCFYSVKVDGSNSSLEAFYNESLRWKMILNRINYSGGFIDAKQVLTAMNVTRTCKQPSWFSKTLANNIIQKYCTSDTIVDCFAGWGMRHDAAVELNKKYIGIDFNNELVQWHKSKGRNIEFGDANIFTYVNDCSVFICPPYSDPKTGRCFEDYNFEGFGSSAKALSQCDWLKIVMKNVPNATEYVMVCKIVDEGFEQYVVEEIENKSHFGVNKEYVLVIRNS